MQDAYNENNWRSLFTNIVRTKIAGLTEFLERGYGLSPEETIDLILDQNYDKDIQEVNEYTLLGRHESEIAEHLVSQMSSTLAYTDFDFYNYGEEYWLGWIITMLIYDRGVSLKEIMASMTADDIQKSFYHLHLINEEYALDWLMERIHP